MTKKKNAATIGKNADGYGYKYADMARVHDYIAEHNGCYFQYTKTDEVDHKCYIWTHRCKDDIISEDIDIRGAQVVDAMLSNGKQNPAQANGSALTYARRYSLYMAYGLAVDDNDAEDLTIPEDYQAPKAPTTWHDKLVQFANEKGILLADVAEQYDLHPGDPEEAYKAALEKMQQEIEW